MKETLTEQPVPRLTALTPTAVFVHRLQLTNATFAKRAFMPTKDILVLHAMPPLLNALTAIPATTPSNAQPAPQDTTSPLPLPVPPAPADKPTASTAIRREQVPFGASTAPAPTTSPTTLQEPALSVTWASPTVQSATRTAPSPTTSAAYTAFQGTTHQSDRPAALPVPQESPTATLARKR